VGEQMTDRGARRSSRLIEVDHALLYRVKNGQSRQRLRHGRPAEHVSRIAVHRADAVRAEDGGSHICRTPRIDDAKDLVEVSHGQKPNRDVCRAGAGPNDP
jgi:hypothetical protein